MKKLQIFFLTLLFATYPLIAIANDSKTIDSAKDSAKMWLALVDNQKYEECWDVASEFFKNAVEKEKLAEILQKARDPFGTVTNRNIKSSTSHTSLPGVPKGKYVVIQFETTFENKKIATETVTPMLDKDGTWKVSGYYIK